MSTPPPSPPSHKTVNILGISGSLRKESFNRKALQLAKKFATETGASVTELDLKELDLPIYDGDIEARGMPESAMKLKQAIEAADVLLIASPEYNFSISSALKNAVDWASRSGNSFDGKIAAIFGASPGAFGTLRGQYHVRQIFEQLNVMLLPTPIAIIPNAAQAFDANGELQDVKAREKLKTLIEKTIDLARKLS